MPMALIMHCKAGLAYLSSLYHDVGRMLQPDERRAQAVGKRKTTCNQCTVCNLQLDTLAVSQFGTAFFSK